MVILEHRAHRINSHLVTKFGFLSLWFSVPEVIIRVPKKNSDFNPVFILHT